MYSNINILTQTERDAKKTSRTGAAKSCRYARQSVDFS